MKKITLLIAISVFHLTVHAQKFELGKVSMDEAKEKIHPKDSSAAAAILYKKGTTFFEFDNSGRFKAVTEVVARIKIYKKEGYDYATISLPYYVGSSRKEEVSFSDAATYNLVGNKIERTKLKSESEFVEEINDNWKQRKIALPSVREGSVIEYKYRSETPYYESLPDWYFQYDIPVNAIEYEVNIPEYFLYNRVLSPYFPVDQKTQTRVATKGTHVSNETRFASVSFSETSTLFSAKDVPALKDERYVDNIQNYLGYVKHQLAMISYPNTPPQRLAMTWEDVTKTVYKHERFGEELGKNSYFTQDMDAVLKGRVTRDDKITAVYNYVQNRMSWNEKYGYLCRDGVERAYKNKVGNAAEINLMLTSMLRYAGLKANPVLLSTRSNGIASYPNIDAYNYVISAVEIEGDVILLDATSKNNVPNMLPVRALNWIGRIVRDNESSAEVSLIPKMASKDNVTLFADIDSKGSIKAKGRVQHVEYSAYFFRESYGKMNQDSYIETLEKNSGGIEIGNYTVSKDDALKPVTEDFEFVHPGMCDVIGDKMYIHPMLFYTTAENPFKQETREYPVNFICPQKDRYVINLTIPEGYVVESIPAPINIQMVENIGSFKFNIANTGNKIQIIINDDINYPSVNPEYYSTLKAFFQNKINKQNEKIVLKRV